MSEHTKSLPGLAMAILLYVAFAAYLYQPYFRGFSTWQVLLPASTSLAAMGCYVLSRRWVAGFPGSFLAGLVYGFGAFMLALGRFHPLASLLAATIPWLFMPSAYLGEKRGTLSAVLALLPFVAVLVFFLFFRFVAEYRLFAVPIQAELEPRDLMAFAAPLVLVNRAAALPSLYHIPIAPLLLGLGMMLAAKRFGVLFIIALGVALTFCPLYLGKEQVAWVGVSPILWLSIPLTCLAVLAGVGLQGLIKAGASDKGWVLWTGLAQAALGIGALVLALKYSGSFFGVTDEYSRMFVAAAKIYALGAIAIGVVFIMAVQKKRWPWLRWAVLGGTIGVDVFLSARYIVDSVL